MGVTRQTVVVLGVAATVLAGTGADTRREVIEVAADCPAGALDGFLTGPLPPGIGGLVSDFDYDFDDVAFRTRVWERGPDPVEGYRVDVRVKVLRGDRLTDQDALRGYLAEYHEHDPATWPTRPWSGGDHRGHTVDDRVFFLVEPGVAVEVDVHPEHVERVDLDALAAGITRCDHPFSRG